jgi:hypothetical protein
LRRPPIAGGPFRRRCWDRHRPLARQANIEVRRHKVTFLCVVLGTIRA